MSPANPDLDRVTRYLRRLDAQLATFQSARARALFLIAQKTGWLDRYATWQAAVAKGTYQGTSTAFDFLEVISAIDVRIGQYARAA